MVLSRLFPVAAGLLFVGAQFGAAFVPISQVALLLICLLHWRHLTAPKWLVVAVAALLGATLFHVAVGTEPVTSWGYATHPRVLLIFLMVGALGSTMRPRQRDQILLAALVAGALSALYALYQVVFQTPGPLVAVHSGALPWAARNYRPSTELLTFSINGLRGTGFIHHVLSFAHVSCILALAAMARALFGSSRRLLWTGLGVAATGGLFLSGMRAALLGWGFGMAALLLLKILRQRRTRMTALCALLAVAGTGFVHIVSTPSLRNQVGSFSGRLPIWAHARETAASVFPRGLGYGAYPRFAERTYPQSPSLKGKVHAWAHNVWLTLAAEAPLAILAWLFFILVLLKRALTQSEGDGDQGFGAGVLATLVAWLVIGLFHDSHFQREYFPVLLGLWGLGLSPGWTKGSQVGSCPQAEASAQGTPRPDSIPQNPNWRDFSRQAGR